MGHGASEMTRKKISEKKRKQITYIVNENGCHVCTSHSHTRWGYSQFYYNGKSSYVHRYIYEQKTGKPIPDGMQVCHHCDNPACINFEHFFLGTQADNTKDMDKKGRRKVHPLRGIENPCAKLTESQVLEIRSSPYSAYQLAKVYPVSERAIMFIKNGRNWKHLLPLKTSIR